MKNVMGFCSGLTSARKRVSMSAEKIFCGESSGFLVVFWALFMVLYGVLWSVFAVLAWCSMLLCVTFNVGMRGD